MNATLLVFDQNDWTFGTDRRYRIVLARPRWWQRKLQTPTVMIREGDRLSEASTELRLSPDHRTLTITVDVPFAGEVRGR